MIRQLYITGRTRIVATFSAALVCAALPAGAVVFGQTAAAVSGQNVISPQPAVAPAPAGLAPTAAVPSAAIPGAAPTPVLSTAGASGAQPVAPGAVPPAAANPTADLATLRARAQALQAQIQHMPTSLAEQRAQQEAANELISVQGQIQQLEAQGDRFSAYRQARDQQALGAFPGQGQPAAANPLAEAQAQNRRQTLAESGLNSGSPAARTAQGPSLTVGEAALLREQKEGLTQQYRQIQQTLRALQPNEAALAENLRKEQATIAAQLLEIDARLASAPQDPLAAQPIQPNVPAVGQIPIQNQLMPVPNAFDAGNDLNARIQKVNQAAQLLREAGLVMLANYAANEAPRLADPNYTEQNLVPGSWAEEEGLAEARNNPFQQVGKDDLDKITTNVDDLKARIDKLAQTLADVETQLKLLTRNSVYAPPTGASEDLQGTMEAVDAVQPAPSDDLTAPETEPAATPEAAPQIEGPQPATPDDLKDLEELDGATAFM